MNRFVLAVALTFGVTPFAISQQDARSEGEVKENVLLEEGQEVKEGQVLVELVQRAQAEAIAQRQLAERAKLKEMQARDQALAEAARAKAEADRAKAQLARRAEAAAQQQAIQKHQQALRKKLDELRAKHLAVLEKNPGGPDARETRAELARLEDILAEVAAHQDRALRIAQRERHERDVHHEHGEHHGHDHDHDAHHREHEHEHHERMREVHEIRERLEHLHAAHEHLSRAGMEELAHEVSERIRNHEREVRELEHARHHEHDHEHGDHEHGEHEHGEHEHGEHDLGRVLGEVMERMELLQRQVQELREEVSQLRRR